MSNLTPGPLRVLTVDERFKWGVCPVCKAPHGEHCRPGIGFPLGMSVDGGWPKVVALPGNRA